MSKHIHIHLTKDKRSVKAKDCGCGGKVARDMSPETERAWRNWMKAANAEGPKGAENITNFNRRQARIVALKNKYEVLLAAEKGKTIRDAESGWITLTPEQEKTWTKGMVIPNYQGKKGVVIELRRGVIIPSPEGSHKFTMAKLRFV